eukprot:gene20100-26097_t
MLLDINEEIVQFAQIAFKHGIQPKTLPVWADSRSTLKSNSIDVIKIWIGTWNLGANDPFVGVDRDRAHRQLSPYISPGYDIYVLGIQEGISDSIYECIEGILAPEGYYRLQLQEDGSNQSNGIIDNSRLYGRGDNSLLSQKFTGIGVFIHRKLRNDIKLLAVSQVPFTNVHSKGGGFSKERTPGYTDRVLYHSMVDVSIRRIKLYDIRLLWGASEISPSYVKVLFPAPYESIAGEKFVDLSCSDEIIDDTFKYRLDSPIKSTPSSPSKSSRIGSYRSQSILSNSSIDSYNPEKLAGSNTDSKIPSVEFTWRGAEPLDKLHICLQIQMITTSLYNNRKEDDADVLTGNCAIGLEQLCKIALVSTGGVHGTASITRILLKEGLPLYTIDKRTMQREQVTLCCKVDLLPSIVSYDN